MHLLVSEFRRRDCIVVTLIDWKPYMLHAHCWFLNSAGATRIVVTLKTGNIYYMHTAGFWIPQGATALWLPDRLETLLLHAHCWFMNAAGRDCTVCHPDRLEPYMLHAHCWFLNSAGRDCIVVTLIDWKPYMLHAHCWFLNSAGRDCMWLPW